MDTNNTISSVETEPIDTNSSIPKEIEPTSESTCYDDIYNNPKDRNDSEVLQEEENCRGKDNIYNDTGVYPD